jgi:type III secretory pathway component EscV
MQSLKHVGRMKGSNKKILVAYRTLPGDAYSCLVVPTENLPDELHNAIINLVESATAQEAYEFAEALDRTQFPDGSRMLPHLHVTGRLIKVGTEQVEMTPSINASIMLSELNQMIAEQRGIAVDDLHIRPGSNDKAQVTEVAQIKKLPAETVDVSKTTSSSVNETAQEVTSFDSAESEAKHYRSQADKLAKQAAEFRRKAEELAPTAKRSTTK